MHETAVHFYLIAAIFPYYALFSTEKYLLGPSLLWNEVMR